MIGLALCIGLLLGVAFGAAGAWAWIESRRDREESEAAPQPEESPMPRPPYLARAESALMKAAERDLEERLRVLANPALVDLHAKVAESLRPELDEYPDEPKAKFGELARQPVFRVKGGPISARPCARCGHPVGEHDPHLAGIVCPTPPEAA